MIILQYLDGLRIENLELQVKKSSLELQVLEEKLRNYEAKAEENPSSFQLTWCERNLKKSLEKVVARKNALSINFQMSYGQPNNVQMNQMGLEKHNEIPFSSYAMTNKFDLPLKISSIQQLQMQEELSIELNCIDIYDFLQDLSDNTNSTKDDNSQLFGNIHNIPTLMNMCALTFPNDDFQTIVSSDAQISSLEMPLKQPMMSNICNNMSHMSTQCSYNTVDPRFISTTKFITECDNSFEAHKNTSDKGQETDNFNNFNNEDDHKMDAREIYKSDDHLPRSLFHDNLFLEDNFGDDMIWPLKMHESDLTKWEDLDFEKFNF
ncbi:uncharacterized protein LOC127242421 [Andrographis paniculata]|uniref:uncharacterized protein LOC127242421 n=1 Tax=Andrographis paniculata TaxID=175694 RepID=UPI0021E80B0E|nr:uncharacterized protein LOC127242421 [Andrographis paniculata]